MKAIFIVYNQTNTERVEYLFDRLAIRGFTTWEQVNGRGSVEGEPRMELLAYSKSHRAKLFFEFPLVFFMLILMLLNSVFIYNFLKTVKKCK